MSAIHLRFQRYVGDRCHYSISGLTVSSDTELAELRNWRTAAIAPENGCYSFASDADTDSAAELYQGLAWIANDHRQVRCWSKQSGLFLNIENLGDFVLSEGGCMLLAPLWPVSEPIRVIEVMLGPGLILPLAYRGVFSLHASAVETENGACAFIAESGQGKSTLACSEGPEWLRIGDDILPTSLEGSTVQARPHFPQLKLESSEQYPMAHPAKTAIRQIFLLAPEDPDKDRDPSVEPLTSAEAALALIQHTVAAKLFPPEMLNRHLQFAAETAALVPVVRLRYPKSFQALPKLRRLVLERLSRG